MIGFVVTLLVTLAFDLLLGIFLGIVSQFLVQLYLGMDLKHAFKAVFQQDKSSDAVKFKFNSALTFSNFMAVKEDIMLCHREQKNVVLDFIDSRYVDHTVLEQLEDLGKTFSRSGLQLQMLFAKNHVALGPHPLSAKKKTPEQCLV